MLLVVRLVLGLSLPFVLHSAALALKLSVDLQWGHQGWEILYFLETNCADLLSSADACNKERLRVT
ncbi:hypothetical protein M758_2G086800 [Ceratodon purpureus]|uniref:Secreted protein n=1 Tax=Ceratodon purpureus TaxID=3225 RepID=A0A8T0IUD9_CERPU|nr:hypothetical protein KC19_2G083700 [Ceratodon purpureus]KAG0625901.1 hypothetical protein M758_2G086800 [Ceratodon purpureus]